MVAKKISFARDSLRKQYQLGFSYLWVLLVIATMSIGLAVVGEQWSMQAERARVAERDWIGAQYVQAIGSYYEAAPAVKRYPPTLADLLHDGRFMVVRRHLRRLYADPFTRETDWELIRAPDGGVMGVMGAPSPLLSWNRRFIYVPMQ